MKLLASFGQVGRLARGIEILGDQGFSRGDQLHWISCTIYLISFNCNSLIKVQGMNQLHHLLESRGYTTTVDGATDSVWCTPAKIIMSPKKLRVGSWNFAFKKWSLFRGHVSFSRDYVFFLGTWLEVSNGPKPLVIQSRTSWVSGATQSLLRGPTVGVFHHTTSIFANIWPLKLECLTSAGGNT